MPATKSIHVFASDFLPFPGCPRTAGGNRSLQVISALRKAGHQVTFSMPIISDLAKRHLDRVVPPLTPDQLWCCENFFDPESVLNRVQPDVAIYCNVNCFRTVKRFAKDIIHILDLYGPLQFEGLLLESPDYDAAIHDAHLLEERCREMVERIRYVDYLVTVSERQKYFWSAYCSLAGFSFADLNVLVCPVCFEVPNVPRRTAPNLTVVYSGGFYPWQNPDRALRATAKLLESYHGATLHIFGGPHSGLPNEAAAYRLLEELQQSPCVQYHGYRPTEEVAETLSTAWCALELMDQNLERELAITGRTVEFLSTGTPVIYNDYSTLSGLIQKYNAGWTVSPSDTGALSHIFEELVSGGQELVTRLSSNARRLALEQFNSESSMSALLRLCEQAIRKRGQSVTPVQRRGDSDSGQRVLAISPDTFALVELRVNNPLRALRQQGLIRGFRTAGVALDHLKNDSSVYDSVLIQRAVPEYIYIALTNLGIPFILDVDDNLLARAAYRRDEPAETSLLTGLRHATVVTVPNPLLVRLLERYSGIALAHKAFVTPNALPFPTPAQPSSEPKQLIWIQSDIAALTTSRHDVVRAVEDVSRRHEIPVVLIGRTVIDQPRFTYQVVKGQIDFAANLQFLVSAPTSIGIAPLETVADPETLDFVAGKSDLKILLFDGNGHPGVYSDAPPYQGSSMRQMVTVVQNSYSDWVEALEFQFSQGWRTAVDRAKQITEERHIDRVTRESWLPALEAGRSPKPVRGTDLYEAFLNGYESRDTAEFIERLASADYASVRGNAVPIGIENEIHKLRREIADLRNSLSWRVTAPLRKLARPLIERNGR